MMSDYRITTQNAACYTVKAGSPLSALVLFRKEYHGTPITEVAKMVGRKAVPVYRLTDKGAVKDEQFI